MKHLLKSIIVRSSPLWDPVYRLLYRVLTGYRGPLPPFFNRRRIGTKWLGDYLHSGQHAADALVRVMERHQSTPLGQRAVLDLGCGCGRIVQSLAGRVGRLTATDIDPTAIAYLRRAFPGVRAEVNGSTPPLPYADRAFDVVYSWSIWTHLPPDTQESWLVEVARVLGVGGLALITTNGVPYFRSFMRSPDVKDPWRGVKPAEVDRLEADLVRDGFLYRDYGASLSTAGNVLSGVTGRYGLAFHTMSHVRERWSRHFDVIEILEATMHNGQDLVVLRKRTLAGA